jgi:Holliday junction resolvase|tara:strand:+ start:3363 stop:3659 length:297 start_codon:yes stop_codon:yes gene_type:complete
MRFAARVDRNQREIIECLREEGASIFSLSSVGKGCPDLLAGCCGETHLIEVKDGEKVPSAQSLTKDQVAFIQSWEGSPVYIIRDVDMARAWIRHIKDK